MAPKEDGKKDEHRHRDDHKDRARDKAEASPPATPRHRDNATPGRRPRGRPRAIDRADDPAAIILRDAQGNPLRRNGTPVPMLVKKINEAMLNGRFLRNQVERDLQFGINSFWRWDNESGEPTASQILQLSNHLDISLEYLLDDDQPVADPAPNRADSSASRLAQMIRSNGLQLSDVERYLMVTATAIELKFQPGQVLKVLIAASKERDAAMGGGHAPAPVARYDGPTIAEQERAREEADRAEGRRRHGGPKPKAG